MTLESPLFKETFTFIYAGIMNYELDKVLKTKYI